MKEKENMDSRKLEQVLRTHAKSAEKYLGWLLKCFGVLLFLVAMVVGVGVFSHVWTIALPFLAMLGIFVYVNLSAQGGWRLAIPLGVVLFGWTLSFLSMYLINSLFSEIAVHRVNAVWQGQDSDISLERLLGDEALKTKLKDDPPDDQKGNLLVKCSEKREEVTKHIISEDPKDISDLDEVVARWLLYPSRSIQKEADFRKILIGEKDKEGSDYDEDYERAVKECVGDLHRKLRAQLPFLIIRWFNGWIQFFTLWAFWVAVLLLMESYCWNLYQQVSAKRFLEPNRDGSYPPIVPVELQRIKNSIAEAKLKLRGTRVPFEWVALNNLCVTALETGELSTTIASLSEVTDHRLKELDSSKGAITYLAWAIPSIGFIGTVLGIGSALGEAGGMLTPDTDTQKSVVDQVTAALGMAFDTTLIALVLSLLLMFLIHIIRMQEERYVLGIQDIYLNKIIPMVKSLKRAPI